MRYGRQFKYLAGTCQTGIVVNQTMLIIDWCNTGYSGVACATGSACSSGSLLPSPVLRAMGVPDEVLHSAMRFSLSSMLTEDEIDEAAWRVIGVVRRLRGMQEVTGR